MRIVKLLVITVAIGSLYFYAKQHSASPSWQTLSISKALSIQFPEKPVSKTFEKHIPPLGRIKLTTYQNAKDRHIFIMLIAEVLGADIRTQKITTLENVIHHINDTAQLTISDKQWFMLRSHPGIEYRASNQQGAVVWCRTIKQGNRLISILYTTDTAKQDNDLRDTFFNSLRLTP